MIERELIRQAYLKEVKEKLKRAKSSYEIAKKDTIEAEGRMVTRYDSTKTETAWLADGYLEEVKELEKCISYIEKNIEFANVSDIVVLDLYKNSVYQKSLEYELSRKGKNSIFENLFVNFLGCLQGDTIIINENNCQVEYYVNSIKKIADKSVIRIESLVTVTDEYGDCNYYITNYRGGIDLRVGNEEIYCVSKQTPIAKALLGKKRGDNIIVPTRDKTEYVIKDLN